MKPHRLAVLFDSHTPYLAFRVNALHRELVRLGFDQHIELHVILTAADWSSYGWAQEGLQGLYEVPVHVLSKEFHGLGLRAFFSASLPKIFFKLSALYLKLRPRLMLVGGYDRPTSLLCRLLSYPFFAKVGVMNDSRFNDAESYSKSALFEFIKSFVVARYSFFMCAGRESADYHRFLGGRNKPIFSEAWDVVDNQGIATAADDATHDADIRRRFALPDDAKFFFFPARFVAKKNVPFVLRAYAAYLATNPTDAHYLVLCGQGPDKDLIQQLCSTGFQPVGSSGILPESLMATAKMAVLHTGGTPMPHSQPRLTDYVKLCDWLPYELMPLACRLSTALILASTHDQWGMTVNEALSAGTPVLVSHRCGAHELVQNNLNGFTFSPNDEAHLTALMGQLHDDPELVARLRSHAAPSMQRFSITQYLERHLELFAHYGLLPKSSA